MGGKTYTFKIRDGVKIHGGFAADRLRRADSWRKIVDSPKVTSARQSFLRHGRQDRTPTR